MILLEKRIFMDMCSNNLCTISFNIYKPTNDWVLYFKNDYTTADSIPSPTFSKLSTINSVIKQVLYNF